MNTSSLTSSIRSIYDALLNVKGCEFVDVAYVGEMVASRDYRKKNNPFNDRVSKLVHINCQFNYAYENAVNNRIAKVGGDKDFVTGSLPWGKWSVFNKFIEHNDALYARFYVAKNCQAKVTYLLDGRPMTDEELKVFKTFLPTPKPFVSAKQEGFGLTENQVKPFAVKLANIVTLTMSKTTYEVDENAKYKSAM